MNAKHNEQTILRNSTPQSVSYASGSCTEQDAADWLSSGGARDYDQLKTATNKTVRFVKCHLRMRLNMLFNQFNKYRNWENLWFLPAHTSSFKNVESANQKQVR